MAKSTMQDTSIKRGLRRYLLPRGVLEHLFGFDVFISYARRDSRAYAEQLQQGLSKLDYSCFLDAQEVPAGEQLTTALRRALRRSTVLVLIGSPGALESKYVCQEVGGFVELNPRGIILPISIGRTLDDAPPDTPVRLALGDRVWITEDSGALVSAPTDRAKSELLSFFRFTRRNTLRLRVTTAVSVVLAVLMLFSLGMFALAQRARLDAEHRAQVSEIQRLAAQSAQTIEEFPQRSLLLAVEAHRLAQEDSRIAPTPWAEQALRDTLRSVTGTTLREPIRRVPWSKIKPVAVSNNGRWVMVIRAGDPGELWDLAAKDPAASSRLVRGAGIGIGVTAATFTHDSESLIAAHGRSVLVYDLAHSDEKPREVFTALKNVNILRITSDQRFLAVCIGEFSDCESLYVVSLKSQPPISKVLITGEYGGDTITDIEFSSDNRWLFSSGTDGTLKFWNLNAPSPENHKQQVSGFAKDIAGLAISGDGKWLVAGIGRKVAVWLLSDEGLKGAPRVLECTGCPFVTAVAISPTGQWIAAGGQSETAISLWTSLQSHWNEEADTHYILQTHRMGVNDLAFSPDSRWLVTAGRDKKAVLWDLTNSRDIADSKLVLSGHEAELKWVVFSADGRWIVTGGEDLSVRVWSMREHLETAMPYRVPVPEEERHIQTQALTGDRRMLVTKTDSAILMWDLNSADLRGMQPTRIPFDLQVRRVALSSNRRWLVTVGWYPWNAVPVLWDLQSRTPSVRPIPLKGHEKEVNTCEISADSHWLVTVSDDGTARLWDLTVSDPVGNVSVFSDHTDIVRAAAFDPNGRFVVTGSMDGKARLWDLKDSNRHPQSTIVADHGHDAGSGITAAAMSDDASWLVTGDYDGLVRVWKLGARTSSEHVTLRGHKKQIIGVAFTPDAQFVVSGSEDGMIHIWNLKTEQPTVAPVRIVTGDELRFLSMSKDGSWIVTGDGETAKLWQARSMDLIPLARATAGRNLSQAEWKEYFFEKAYRKTFDDLLPGE